jgi:hypothetical protein
MEEEDLCQPCQPSGSELPNGQTAPKKRNSAEQVAANKLAKVQKRQAALDALLQMRCKLLQMHIHVYI